MRHFQEMLVLLGIALAGASLLVASSAEAAYPGANGKIFFGGSSTGADIDIYSINPDGTGMTNLTDLPGGTGEGGNPSVSGDGSKLAYVVGTQGTAEIWTMNADGTSPVQLTNDGLLDEHPSISADGSRIAYFHQGPMSDRDDWIMNSDGSGKEVLLDGSQEDYYPVFTPDGTKVVLSSEITSSLDIGIVPSTGGPFTTATKLTDTPPPTQERTPSVTPDGTRVAFERYVTLGERDIYSVGIDGSAEMPIATTPGVLEFSPAFSPDGTKIAFISGTTAMIANANGSGATPLAISGLVFFGDLEWAPAVATGPPPPPPDTTDRTPPNTSFKGKLKKRITKPKVKFKFTSDEPGSAFACKLDRGKLKPCSSPAKLKRLKPGKHMFLVQATDVAGNVDASPAKAKFKVVER